MGNLATPEIELEVSDLSGQKVFRVANAPAENSVGQLVDEMVARMRLPRNEPTGAILSYAARLKREGRHLNASESIGDALEPNDHITLHPNIDAG